MEVDVEMNPSNSMGDSASQDNGAAAPDHSDKQPAADPQGNGATGAETNQPKADNRPRPSSSANPNATSQNPQQKAVADQAKAGLQQPAGIANRDSQQAKQAGPVDWQKQYSELQSHTQRKINEIERRDRERDQELSQLRQYRQEQAAQAERQKLKPWSKQHPENPKFQGLLQRAQTVRQQLASVDPKLPPEQQELARNAILSALSDDDHQQLTAYRQESEQFEREFFQDPQGTILPFIQREFQNLISQFQTHQRAQVLVDQDFKALEPVLKEHGPELAELLDRKVPYDVAVENVRLKAQLGALQSRVGDVEKANLGAQEQQRLAKGHASHTRDPVPSSKPDIYAMAKKEAEAKGLKTDDPRFMAILSRIEANYRTK